jgi:hypothetical protein
LVSEQLLYPDPGKFTSSRGFIGYKDGTMTLNVNLIKAFGIINAQGTCKSGLNQSSEEGQILDVICPRLGRLHIEGVGITRQPDLMPVLKDIVTLRAMVGSPLKSFTLLGAWRELGADWGAREFHGKKDSPCLFIFG